MDWAAMKRKIEPGTRKRCYVFGSRVAPQSCSGDELHKKSGASVGVSGEGKKGGLDTKKNITPKQKKNRKKQSVILHYSFRFVQFHVITKSRIASLSYTLPFPFEESCSILLHALNTLISICIGDSGTFGAK